MNLVYKRNTGQMSIESCRRY